VNGIDYTEWNPAADPDLFLPFSAAEPTGKAANKKGLQQLLGLEESANTPLLGIVSRLSAQKGFNLIAKILPRITAEKLQLVILGSGEEEFIQLLTKMKGAGTKSFSFNFGFDSGLAHKIYAGCDILLMPSQFEPCGLSQLIAMRYGTVPVVRKTGGLADTVKDPRDAPAATGFSFETYSSVSLWASIMRALRTRKDMKSWKKIVRQGMKTDFSWGVSALRYEELYRLGLKKKGIINASGKRAARRTDPGNQEGHS
jgi:starch synthase